MKPYITKILSFLLVLILAVGTLPLSAAASTEDEAEPGFIFISESDVENYGFYGAVQSALNEARDHATAELPYTIVAPAGEYDLTRALRIYSNTSLGLDHVTLKRVNGGNMLRVGDEDSAKSGVTGYAYENIRVLGGTFDGNGGANTIIKAFHTKNFVMDSVRVMNEKEGHMTEFAGVDGLTICGCAFQNQTLTPGHYGYEAVQLDVLHPFHITNARCEDLPVSNVLIEKCSFDNVPRAVGSHTAVHNRPHSNIVIHDNVFTNLSSIAIQGMGWTNVDIRSNYIENAPRGITVYAEPGGCTYLPSVLGKEGNTSTSVSDSYQKPSKANINIAYNMLYNVGTSADKYARYASQGIAVLGEKLTAKSAVDSSDGSGGLPAGDYYIDGVNIHDNFIDIRGNGVRLEDVRNASVTSNTIVCSKNTVVSDNYYGIKLRDNVTASSVSYNTIYNAEINALQLDGTNGGCSVNLIQYNRVYGTGNYGIVAYSATLGKIYDNDIMYTVNRGIHLDGTTVKEMKWNRVRNCSERGIWVTSNSSVSDVKSNTIVNCTTQKQYGNCTDTNPYTASKPLENFYIPWSNKMTGAEMGVGTMFKIVPDVRPTNAFAEFTYESSDEDTVYVDESGMVYALQEGYATITVASDNGLKKSYTIAVEGDKGVTHVASKPKKPVLLYGDADGNETVESIDATLVQRWQVYMDIPVNFYTFTRADVDGSGVPDLVDVTAIQYWLAGLKTEYDVGGVIR